LNYYFEDFTEKNYRTLLGLAKKNYVFESFSNMNEEKKIVLWRHDVDFSVHRALQLAKIEYEEEVKATYFFQLNSEFYNIFEAGIKDRIHEILSLGHSIGLHFDPSAYNFTTKVELEKHLMFEKEILEELFARIVMVFSFHNPEPNILKYDDYKIANMINAYSLYMKENYVYCSDSNGYWRHERLVDVLLTNEFDKLQILTHPVWWQKNIIKFTV